MIVRKLRNMIVSELVSETVRNRLGRDGKSTPRLSSFFFVDLLCGSAVVVWMAKKDLAQSTINKQDNSGFVVAIAIWQYEEGIRGLRNESSQFVGKEGQGVHLIYLLKLEDGSERLKFW